MNADGGKDHLLAAGITGALSTDGALLYYMQVTRTTGVRFVTGNLMGINADTGAVIRQLPVPVTRGINNSFFTSLAFNRDGKRLIEATVNGLLLMNADGSNLLKLTGNKTPHHNLPLTVHTSHFCAIAICS